MTGVLDELKICFYHNKLVMFTCSCDMKFPFCKAPADSNWFYSFLQHEQSFLNVLLADEHCLFEFRAIGGQVRL